MHTITSITVQEKNKERCNLFVDNEFKCGLSLETVMKYRLKKGEQIDEERLNVIILEGQKNDALNKAVEYVSKALKTKRQVKDYLIKKGYDEQIAYYVIDKLKEYELIDDVVFAKRFIEYAGKNQGRKLIEYKLFNKGVKKSDIESAFIDVEFTPINGALNVLEKYMRNKEKTIENKAKAYRYLAGKGYMYEEIDSAISKIFKGED